MKKHVLIDNKPVALSDTKAVWSFSGPSPESAKMLFRITTVLTTVASVWVAATGLVPDNVKTEVMLGLKCLDMLALGYSKARGLVEDK